MTETQTQMLDQIQALRAALQPFASMADAYDPPEGDDHELAWDRKPTLGELRAARAALASPAPQKPTPPSDATLREQARAVVEAWDSPHSDLFEQNMDAAINPLRATLDATPVERCV